MEAQGALPGASAANQFPFKKQQSHFLLAATGFEWLVSTAS